MNLRAAMAGLRFVLGAVLGGAVLVGCVVNPVPTPSSTGSLDKGGAGQTEETPTAGKDAGTNRQFGGDVVSGGDAVTGGMANDDGTSSADTLAADATDLAADATVLAADATETGDVL